MTVVASAYCESAHNFAVTCVLSLSEFYLLAWRMYHSLASIWTAWVKICGRNTWKLLSVLRYLPNKWWTKLYCKIAQDKHIEMQTLKQHIGGGRSTHILPCGIRRNLRYFDWKDASGWLCHIVYLSRPGILIQLRSILHYNLSQNRQILLVSIHICFFQLADMTSWCTSCKVPWPFAGFHVLPREINMMAARRMDIWRCSPAIALIFSAHLPNTTVVSMRSFAIEVQTPLRSGCSSEFNSDALSWHKRRNVALVGLV
jgi:hypothetical protein